jgi:hypothetical protein
MEERELIEKRNERYDAIYKTSEKVSNINRNFNITGVANVWLLLHYAPSLDFKSSLLLSLLLFGISFLLEYAHYIMEIIIKWLYSTFLLVKSTSEGNVVRDLPKFILYFSWAMWSFKIVSTITAYIILGIIIFKIM